MPAPLGHRGLIGGALLCLCLLLGIVGGIARPRPATSAGAPLGPRSAEARVVESAVLRGDGRRERASEPEPAPGPGPEALPSAREFLASYHGERWPEIEARIQASGLLALDTPYRFRPWEEVEGEFRAAIAMTSELRAAIVRGKLHWPEVLTPEFVVAEYTQGRPLRPLEPADLDALEAVVAAKNAEIAALGDVFASQVDRHVQERWIRGQALIAPFTTAGLPAEHGFHSQSHAGHGWAVTITLTWEDHPDLLELSRELETLRDERDLQVLAHLGTLARR